jgi:hypothetical protein
MQRATDGFQEFEMLERLQQTAKPKQEQNFAITKKSTH